jgi:hypothetical protein
VTDGRIAARIPSNHAGFGVIVLFVRIGALGSKDALRDKDLEALKKLVRTHRCKSLIGRGISPLTVSICTKRTTTPTRMAAGRPGPAPNHLAAGS